MERKDPSLIQSAVPAERGPVKHFEHTNNTAFTRFVGASVEEIHTPQDTLKRIHEVLHARHTNPKAYPGITEEVSQVVEDCRLHMKHWPWAPKETPTPILTDAIATIKDELKRKTPGYADFATKLRACAVYRGLNVPAEFYPEFEPSDQLFARQVLDLIDQGEEELAAKLIEKVFFDDTKDDEDDEVDGDDDGDEDGDFEASEDGRPRPKGKIKVFGEKDPKPEKRPPPSPLERKLLGSMRMEIIELEKVEPTQAADAGFRLATSGARLYRPALRRPILSPRLFLKKAPYDPIGVICFDSSGSMYVTPELLSDCCRRAPTAVVGYYEGSGGPTGWLWVYSRDGMRARETPLTGRGGNGVDGPAMDWMLTFDGPRIMVTDRGFCDAYDSYAQKARLANLERLGEIKVYTSFADFQKAFPPLVA